MAAAGDRRIVTPSPPVPTGQKRLSARLRAIAELDADDLAGLEALPMIERRLAAGEAVARQGERTRESCIVIEGFLQRHKDLPDGRRQILAFHVPGDVPDLQSLHLPTMDHTLEAVTPSIVAMVAHTAVEALIRARPAIGRALWREALIDGAKFREWIANLGGRAAYPRLAHLFCELYLRNRSVGLVENDGFFMPLTQGQLAEALGLSAVHVNRMMSALRRDSLILLEKRRLLVLDWAKLQQLAEFDPLYLHLSEPG